jgi:hypothetical protein
MKPLAKFLSLAVVFAFLLAGNTRLMAQNQPLTEEVTALVCEAIHYPDHALTHQMQGDVLVSIVPQRDGKLKVECINSGVPELKEYVYGEISSLSLNHPLADPCGPICLRFCFKLK